MYLYSFFILIVYKYKFVYKYKYKRNSLDLKPGNQKKKDFSFNFGVQYFGRPTRIFARQLSKLVKNKFQVDLNVYFTTFKTGQYFKLKCRTPVFLLSNVVYKYSCSCDTNKSYIGMTSRHLIERVQEHFNFSSKSKSPIKDHIENCSKCQNHPFSINNFTVMKHCNSEYDTKIHEALTIKKYNPSLNTQLFANGSSFLLNVY